MGPFTSFSGVGVEGRTGELKKSEVVRFDLCKGGVESSRKETDAISPQES